MRSFLSWISISFSLIICVPSALAQSTLLVEDFQTANDTMPPGNWSRSQDTSSVGWEFSTADSLASLFFKVPGHSVFAASNDDAHDDQSALQNQADQDFLITPPLDLSNVSNLILQFDAYFTGKYGSDASVEVTTDSGQTWTLVDSLNGKPAWRKSIFDLSAFGGNNNIQIGFHHNDNGQWASGFAVDNVEIRETANHDVAIAQQKLPRFMKIGFHPLELTVYNFGSQQLNRFIAEWSIDNETPLSDTITNVTIATGQSYTFTHPAPLNLLNAGLQDIKVAIKQPNGKPDADTSNNLLHLTTSTVSKEVSKNVIIHEYTSAQCGLCPDGAYKLQQILDTSSQAIGVSIHEGDAMDIQASQPLIDAYVSSLPAGDIDRFLFEGRSTVTVAREQWMDRFLNRKEVITPVSLTASNSLIDSSSKLAMNLTAEFHGKAIGEFRLNAYIIEDSVSGTGQGFDQRNFFNNTNGHPFQGAGDTIAGFQHRHAMRAITGGPWGYAGSIDDTCQIGETFSLSDTIPLNAQWDTSNLSIVAFVQQYDSLPQKRPILNAVQMSLNSASANQADTIVITSNQEPVLSEELQALTTSIFPNPAKETIQLSLQSDQARQVTIEAFDITGQHIENIYSGRLHKGRNMHKWDASELPPGLYLIRIRNPHFQQTKKVILSR